MFILSFSGVEVEWSGWAFAHSSFGGLKICIKSIVQLSIEDFLFVCWPTYILIASYTSGLDVSLNQQDLKASQSQRRKPVALLTAYSNNIGDIASSFE